MRVASLAHSYKYQPWPQPLYHPNFITNMPSRDTIVVRNLPELTTEADIQTFFNTRIRNAETLVFPLVDDSQRAAGKLKCATVELNHAVKDKALKYNGEEFIPAA